MSNKLDKNKLNTTESGNTGEHYVLAKLLELGYIATLVDRNTRVIDILACNHELTKYVAIQVKTSQNDIGFRLSKKNESHIYKSLYYIFINLNRKTTQIPEYYVVSAKKVAEKIKKNHAQWLASPGKNGGVHRDTDMRTYYPTKGGDAKDDFSILGLD